MFGTNSGRVVIDLLKQRSSRSQWILRNKSGKVIREREKWFLYVPGLSFDNINYVHCGYQCRC